MIMPTLLGRACDLCPEQSGEATALMCMACSLGAVVIPWICGRLMETAGGKIGIQTLPVCLLLIAALSQRHWMSGKEEEGS
jgi:fucose permease